MVKWVDVVASDGTVSRTAGKDIAWRYRSSGLDSVVVAAQLSLAPAEPRILRRELTEHLRWRKRGTPFDQPCCGSVFRNPGCGAVTSGAEEIPMPCTAGWLIDRAGLKGYRVGGAEVSSKHANYIVNTGGATAADVRAVIDRRLDGRTYTFGISGLLLNSNVLLYDRTDDALWSQVGLTAISGPNAGRTLRHLPWELTAFGGWRTANPKATVVTFDTGYDRAYGQSPYGDYFSNDRLLYPLVTEDRRLPRKDPVVGVKIGATTRAYPVRTILKATDGIVRDTIEGQEIVLQADRESFTVRVVEAPPEAIVVYSFWFAWGAFHPEPEIYNR